MQSGWLKQYFTSQHDEPCQHTVDRHTSDMAFQRKGAHAGIRRITSSTATLALVKQRHSGWQNGFTWQFRSAGVVGLCLLPLGVHCTAL